MTIFSQPNSMRENLLPGSLVFSGEQKMEKPRIRCFDYTKSELKELEVSTIDEVFPLTKKEDSVTWATSTAFTMSIYSGLSRIGSRFTL